jgi:hypothetical protein
VFKCLADATQNALPFEQSAQCDRSGRRIHISLRHLGRRIAIMVDGPSHLIKTADGAYELNGKTRFRNRVLEGFGWRVISVQFLDERSDVDVRKLLGDLIVAGSDAAK